MMNGFLNWSCWTSAAAPTADRWRVFSAEICRFAAQNGKKTFGVQPKCFLRKGHLSPPQARVSQSISQFTPAKAYAALMVGFSDCFMFKLDYNVISWQCCSVEKAVFNADNTTFLQSLSGFHNDRWVHNSCNAQLKRQSNDSEKWLTPPSWMREWAFF